jgi:ABC-type multidrug transport system fused ATPase/permease subunit
LSIRGASGTAAPTFRLAEDLGLPLDTPEAVEAAETRETLQRVLRLGHPGFRPRIALRDVAFTYPGADTPAIHGLDLTVAEGMSVALVGRSGAGKSTLADLILGVLKPDRGTVTVAGRPPGEAIRLWPGGIAYVPQEVMLTNDSIRANVALGLPLDTADDDLVWEALRRANLEDLVRTLPEALDTQVGERGLRLSGGQRQRIGIARALFTKPGLLVLDEATSALDAETEQAISEMLRKLDEDVTTVIVAHRLSTIRHADLVMYLDDGVALATGTFDEVCERIPALQRQAELMGLRRD